jgi:protein TonB
MFDAVLKRDTQPARTLGRGAVVSIVAHVVIVLAIGLFSAREAGLLKEPEVDVALVKALPPPPPPPPPPAASKTPKTEKPKVEKKPDTIVQPKEPVPVEATPPPTEEPAGPPDGQEGGQEGGVAGGVAGGVVGGVVGNQLHVVPFGAGMTRPEQVAGEEPQIPREALVAKVSGLVIAKCTIQMDGTLTKCRIIKGLPFMDEPVLKSLATRKFKPMTYQGRVVPVEYTFNIKIVQAH